MAQEDISALVVVDQGGFLAGIITRVDLLQAYDTHTDWKTAPVEEFMNPQVVTVTPSTRLSQVTGILLDKGIHRVVVVQEEGNKARPVGVVSAADLLYHMVKRAKT
jgi:CBS domain-containing protein